MTCLMYFNILGMLLESTVGGMGVRGEGLLSYRASRDEVEARIGVSKESHSTACQLRLQSTV